MKRKIGRVIPGLSLSSNQIRSRLKNRTLQKHQYDESDYINSEDLIAITKMNKVEREMAHRQTLQEINDAQKRIEESSNRKKAKLEEERINRLANERLAQMQKDVVKKEIPNT